MVAQIPATVTTVHLGRQLASAIKEHSKETCNCRSCWVQHVKAYAVWLFCHCLHRLHTQCRCKERDPQYKNDSRCIPSIPYASHSLITTQLSIHSQSSLIVQYRAEVLKRQSLNTVTQGLYVSRQYLPRMCAVFY